MADDPISNLKEIEKAILGTVEHSKELVDEFSKLNDKIEETNKFIRDMKKGFEMDEVLNRLNKTAGSFFEKFQLGMIKDRQAIIESSKAMLAYKKEIEELTKADEIKNKEEIDFLQLLIKRHENRVNAINEELLAQVRLSDEMKNFSEVQKSAAESFASRWLGVQDRTNSGFQQMFQHFEDGGQKISKFSIMIKEWGIELKRLFSPMNLLDNLLSKMKESTMGAVLQWDSAINSFERSTGIIDKYNDEIYQTWRTNLDLTASAEEVANAQRELILQFRTFTTLSEQTRKEFLQTSVILEKLGVSAGDSSQAFSIMGDTLGMNHDGIKTFNAELFGLTKQMGVSLAQAFSELNTAMPKLTKHGREATDVFLKLTAQAKSLKISTNELLDAVAGYDSFDEAVPKVARLNAILGGPYLNTIQMMKAEEGERVETLIQMINASGKVWTELSKQEKIAIANAAGISDMNTATKIFNGSLEDYRKNRLAANISEKEAEEQAKKTSSLLEKGKSILSAFAVLIQPLADAVSALASAFLWLNDKLGGVPAILASVGIAFILLKKVLDFSSIFKNLTLGMSTTAAASTTTSSVMSKSFVGLARTIGTAISTIATTISAAAPAILIAGGAIGLAIAAVAGGVWLFGKAIKEVDEAFSGLGKEKARVQMMKDLFAMGDYSPKMDKLAQSITAVTDAFSNAFSASKFTTAVIDNWESLISSITDLSKISVSASVTPFVQGIGRTIENVTNLKEENVTQFKNLTTEIKTVANTSANNNPELIKLMGSITSLVNSINNSQNSSRAPIVVELDGKEIGRAAMKDLNNTLGNPTSRKI